MLNAIDTLFEENPVAMMLCDHNNEILRVNKSMLQMLAVDARAIVGKNPRVFASPMTPRTTYKDMWQSIKLSGRWSGKVWNMKSTGEAFPVMLFIAKTNEGGYVASFHEIILQEDASNKLRRMVNHDHLTNLYNRKAIHCYIDKLISVSAQVGNHFAVLYLDMNRFKSVNDLLGHSAGDAMLIEIAKRVTFLIRNEDMAGRIGGDEFVIILNDVNPLAAGHIANRIRAALSVPYKIAGKEVFSSPSIGVAVFPEDGNTSELLLHNADTAMYKSKASGLSGDGGNVKFFSKDMDNEVLAKLLIESDLRSALMKGELFLHYQPQFDTDTMKIFRVEALLRWVHPTLGNIPPDMFIPVAEECGLIVQIGGWVIEEALAELASWKLSGVKDVGVAINLSSCQLKQLDLPSQIAEALERNNLKGTDLEVEVTESVAVTNPEQAAEMIENLHRLGIKVSLDDFGTGYSSLAYLKQLPIDSIKLDKSFVQHADIDHCDASISISAINLSRALNLNIIAEGVETTSQYDFLRANQCHRMQGFLLCHPLPGTEALRFVRNHNKSIIQKDVAEMAA